MQFKRDFSNLAKSEATSKGHLDQIRRNLRPTKTQDEDEMEPTQEPNKDATYQLFASFKNSGKIYTDQTGRFPVTPSKRNKYILIMYRMQF